eukprot:gene9990-biopygen4752
MHFTLCSVTSHPPTPPQRWCARVRRERMMFEAALRDAQLLPTAVPAKGAAPFDNVEGCKVLVGGWAITEGGFYCRIGSIPPNYEHFWTAALPGWYQTSSDVRAGKLEPPQCRCAVTH